MLTDIKLHIIYKIPSLYIQVDALEHSPGGNADQYLPTIDCHGYM